ncbi:uncharacterized protein LOC132935750 isoform X1 [Metopolophium dirhodum]|uniref:uncharacterized protein LOC132935750 isoform X1 n=1 Tax=Metopolophium dirhodum TaxID=44670 RepID=UPI00298FD24B|nr:uncharacterized protein LOC132935750 isoform X1 [Metopolophium dirhodum]
MVTARCTRGLTAGTTAATDCSDFGHSVNDKQTSSTTATRDTVCHCLACCYVTTTVTTALQPPVVLTTRRNSGKTAVDASESSDSEPPSEAAAFVASASAAALVLLAALLAVVLSSAALLTVASMVPLADAATSDVRRPQAADYIHLWHHQQQQKQQQQQQVVGQRIYDSDALRQKRQLFNTKTNREPGVVALTFSLIGGTFSDARQAFRNVSSIVRDTISEAARDPAATTAAADQMMMAAVNTADNEVGGGAASTTVATDQRMAGQTLGKLLGRNYRGLRRLFDSELRSAVKNSPGNVRDFAVELMGSIGQSLRPSNLFSRGLTNGTTTTASRR